MSKRDKFHPDVYDRPHYVIANPFCYTREEIAEARRVAFWNPVRSPKPKNK